MKIKKDILASHERIAPYIHRTPVLTSTFINGLTGSELYFKCENFQKMGAFKMRGATNALLQLSEKQKQRGVVTHSSGNFAQALSLAAKNLGIKAYIVMPSNAPTVKKKAVEDYQGQITECLPTLEAREATAKQIQDEKGATFVHPFNDFNVILGNATAAKELFEEVGQLDYLIAPVGGGGLIAGAALSALSFGDKCKIIGAEPFEVDDAFRSLEAGEILHNKSTNTLADGLKTSLGDITFSILDNYIDKIIRVTEQDLLASMGLVWERMKIIIEPSSAVALAAIFKEKPMFAKKRVGLLLSGGNVDLLNLPF